MVGEKLSEVGPIEVVGVPGFSPELRSNGWQRREGCKRFRSIDDDVDGGCVQRGMQDLHLGTGGGLIIVAGSQRERCQGEQQPKVF
jgi:hypothetical protein